MLTTLEMTNTKATASEANTSDAGPSTSKPTDYSEDSIRANHHSVVNRHDKPQYDTTQPYHCRPSQAMVERSTLHQGATMPLHCVSTHDMASLYDDTALQSMVSPYQAMAEHVMLFHGTTMTLHSVPRYAILCQGPKPATAHHAIACHATPKKSKPRQPYQDKQAMPTIPRHLLNTVV